MPKEKKPSFTLNTVDDMFTTQEVRDERRLPKIRELPLNAIVDFPDHPFIRNRTVLNILSGEEAVDGWHFWGRLSSDRREAKEFANNWEEIVSVAERNRNQDRE